MEVDRDLALLATRAAEERKADNVLLLELKGLTVVADYFLIASGGSVRQVRAIAEHLEEALSAAGLRLRHREGLESAKWVLLDFGGLVCHIFSHADRDFYGLERFWGDAPRVDAPQGAEGAPTGDESGATAEALRARVVRPRASRGSRPGASSGPPRPPSE